jgi:hypothetical protein
MRMFIEPLAVYLHRDPIDFRVGIDGLAMRVEQEMARGALALSMRDGTSKSPSRLRSQRNS